MANLRTIVDVNISESEEKEQIEQYYLLHWGMTYTIAHLKDGPVPVHYTVGICQHIKTGQIHLFYPGQIKVVGKEVKQ